MPDDAPAELRTAGKGAYVRGLVIALRREQLFDKVLARLTGRPRLLLLEPPLATAWVANEDTDTVHETLLAVSDLATCHRCGHIAAREGMAPLQQSFVSGALRLFGATPHTLFSRLGELNKLNSRGTAITYERTGERSCGLAVSYTIPTLVPDSSRHAMAGGIETVLVLCNVKGGAVEPLERSPGQLVSRATFRAHW